MKESNKNLQKSTNQIGRGDPPPDSPTLELVRPPEVNNFVLEVLQSKSFKQRNAVREVTYRATLKNPSGDESLNNLIHHLHALFDTVLLEAKEEYGENGVMRIYINHPKLEKAIIIPPTHLEYLDAENILKYIDAVLYSAGEIPADDALEINAGVVHLIEGSGRKSMTNLEDDIKSKKSFVRIANNDHSCLSRAIVVGYRHLLANEKKDRESRQHYTRIRDSRLKAQGLEAAKLRQDVGIFGDAPGKLDDVPLYEKYLKVRIVVLSSRIGNKRVYAGSPQYDKQIFIYHTEKDGKGHFDTITKVNGLMARSYYCEHCDKAFQSKTGHKCKIWCNICGRKNCRFLIPITCPDCNRTCRGQECFTAHKEEIKNGRGKNKDKPSISICNQFWQCPDCGINIKREYRNPEDHECGEVKCKVCHQFYLDSEVHLCHMRAFTSDVEPKKFIFYDFECMQETGEHVPNLVVAHSICDKCQNDKIDSSSKCNSCGSRCELCNKFNKKTNDWERYPCITCGHREVIFSGENTSEAFCKWLINEQHKNVTAIAHNGRAYDAYFIYNYLMKNSIIPEPSIFNGSKIMYMKVGRGLNIRLIDSLNFLPMPLSSLPKSFGLTELKKGFFPHFYNTREHQNDVLNNLPAMQFYDPDGMTKERRIAFLQWYAENQNQKFDFQKEMREYCISDVNILLEACWKFRDLLRRQTGEEQIIEDINTLSPEIVFPDSVDPFSYLTIASVCMGVFRSKFLTETYAILLEEGVVGNCSHKDDCKCQWLEGRRINATSPMQVLYNGEWIDLIKCNSKKVAEKFIKTPIALIPCHGYAGRDNHSKDSIEWLTLLEKNWNDNGRNIEIQHARSQKGEKVIPCQGKTKMVRYRVDGYFEFNGEKYVCEYHGCNFHGCLQCFPRDRETTMNDGKSMAQRHRETMLKEKRLTDNGYIVLSKWSCDFMNDKKNEHVLCYLKSVQIQEPINIRDCYFGGRTNALVLHKKFENGEKGHYVDFTSLYPDILKYRRFPVSHPVRIIKDFKPVYAKECDGKCFYAKCNGRHWALPYFGIIKATFYASKNILHPVLPLKCNGKLKFPLCYNCACKEQDECNCTHSERSFTHTYCTPEVDVAINLGYDIIRIHEILHWNETEIYDPETKQGGLFTGYINTFLKLKQEASGFPDHLRTDEERNDYIVKYYEHEGILLDRTSIVKNPGLRSLSKLALNSFYGKFGQRTNLKKTKFITDLETFYNILTDPSTIVTDFHIMNEDIIEVEYKSHEDFEPLSVNTNVTIAAFCTSWARLKLWSEMNKLGDRVLYHDTDSIIYSVKNEGEYIPKLGEYLGELTSELTCKELGCNIINCSGHWIEEFVSCGPKNYSYRVNTGQIVCKVRGFSLNYKASQILNFESMKEALYAWKQKKPYEIVTVKTEIVRNKHEPKVINRVVGKHYGVVYDKRKVLPDFTTLPFGYK